MLRPSDSIFAAPVPVPSPEASRPARVDSLTGLRFFAAVAVVLCHVGGGFVFVSGVTVADGYGYVGVTFFFLLSGFVLTWSCTGQAPRRFWWLRFSRVWPLACVMMIFSLTVISTQEKMPGLVGRVADVLLLQSWSANQQVYFGGNGVTWSLSAELFFYAMFPFVSMRLVKLRGRGLAVTALVTLAVLAGAPLIGSAFRVSAAMYYWLFFVFPPYRFGEFLLGMVLARAVMLGFRAPKPVLTTLAGLVGSAAAIWFVTWFTLRTGTQVQRPDVALLVIPCFVLLLWGCASGELAGRRSWLTSRPMLRLGEWSFALYLVHKPTYLPTSHWGWWHNQGGIAAVLWFAAYLAAAVCVAAALSTLIERPVERRLRRLAVFQARPRSAC